MCAKETILKKTPNFLSLVLQTAMSPWAITGGYDPVPLFSSTIQLQNWPERSFSRSFSLFLRISRAPVDPRPPFLGQLVQFLTGRPIT